MLDLEKFQLAQLSAGRSAKGTKDLSNCLRLLPRQLSLESYREYLAALLRDKKYGSAKQSVAALRAYGQYSHTSWMAEFPYPRIRYKPVKDFLTEEEQKKVLECQPEYDNAHEHLKETWHKYSVFFYTCAHTGMRPFSEVATLRKDQFNWGTGFIHLHTTKTGKSRKIPLTTTLARVLRPYYDSCEDYLFETKPGFLISSATAGTNFRSRLRKCGIKQRPGLTVHSFRHAVATELLQSGVNLFDVQAILGHSSSETTAQYYHTSDDQLKKAIERLPIARDDLPPEKYLEELGEANTQALKLLRPISSGFKITEDKDGNLVYEYRVVVKKKKYKHP